MPKPGNNIKRLEELLQECINTFKDKELEYGPDTSGFEFIASFENRNSIEVCMTLLLKHIDVLRMWMRTPEELSIKVLRHRLIDAINYLALLEDEWEKTVNKARPTEPTPPYEKVVLENLQKDIQKRS
jgi:hypothetical protein